jgi:hypothetical protein
MVRQLVIVSVMALARQLGTGSVGETVSAKVLAWKPKMVVSQCCACRLEGLTHACYRPLSVGMGAVLGATLSSLASAQVVRTTVAAWLSHEEASHPKTPCRSPGTCRSISMATLRAKLLATAAASEAARRGAANTLAMLPQEHDHAPTLT